MQAVILVGGEGTRLRPLTSTAPKPVIRLVDRPFMAYMLEWLRSHGVEQVIMACGFLADGVRDVLGDGSDFGLELEFVVEPEPLGTGGALKFAETRLQERFLMLNGDVLTDLDLTALIAQHEQTGARATLSLVPVEDPSAYGVVLLNADSSVGSFVEKPAPGTVDSNLISAGAYVLEREILDLLDPGRSVSIEREVWPRLVGDGLYGFAAESYWLDIGTPERYLQGTFDIITGDVRTNGRAGGEASVGPGARVEGELGEGVVIEGGVQLASGSHVGPLAVLGENVSVGAGTRIERAVVLAGTRIGERCELRDCIVAAGCNVGEGTKISGGAVLGENVTIGARGVISGDARIFPGVEVPDGAIVDGVIEA